ncbi:MAG: tetratricopeptide repeat protein [Gammaproteobacteria bacterium]|nr:tetratricopeptide repeat protein [Gammaproteobacteria bacterium]
MHSTVFTSASLVFIFLLTLSCAGKQANIPRPSQNMGMFQQSVSPETKKSLAEGAKLLRARQYGKAESIFLNLAKANPQLLVPNMNLALIYLQQERLLEAESMVREVLKKNSRRPEAYNLLGVVLRQQGRFAEAETAYKYALQIDSRYAGAHMNIAILYDIYLLDYEKAKRHYRALAELEPDQEKQVNAWLADMLQRAQASN